MLINGTNLWQQTLMRVVLIGDVSPYIFIFFLTRADTGRNLMHMQARR